MGVVAEFADREEFAVGRLDCNEVTVGEAEIVSGVWVQLDPRLGR
jgi:hypothetical protein